MLFGLRPNKFSNGLLQLAAAAVRRAKRRRANQVLPSQLLSTFLLLAVRLLFELVVQFFSFRDVHIRGILFV